MQWQISLSYSSWKQHTVCSLGRRKRIALKFSQFQEQLHKASIYLCMLILLFLYCDTLEPYLMAQLFLSPNSLASWQVLTKKYKYVLGTNSAQRCALGLAWPWLREQHPAEGDRRSSHGAIHWFPAAREHGMQTEALKITGKLWPRSLHPPKQWQQFVGFKCVLIRDSRKLPNATNQIPLVRS